MMMNAQQRQAWFFLAVFGVTAVAYFAAVPLIGFKAAFGTFFITGLAGFGPLIGLRERRSGKVCFDERDLLIARAASLAGFAAAWLVFVIACMAMFFVKGPHGTIPVTVMPMVVCICIVVLTIVRSLTVLILYRKQDNDSTQ